MKLSIAMIVKNEEKNIERCLKSFNKIQKEIKSEIIIVDTGSTDNTINIAKEYTDKVYEHKWNEDFSEMRNISISYCKGEWILIVDADEVLEDEKEIINFFKYNEKKYNSALIKFKNFSSINNDSFSLGKILRLFRNNKDFRYEGIVHEQPNFKYPILDSNIVFLHYGYDTNDYKLMIYKFERNKDLLIKALEKDNENPYIYFQLAQTYSMANDKKRALIYIEKAYNLLDEKYNTTLYIYIYNFYVKTLFDIKEYEKVITISKKAIDLGANDLDFYYFLAKGNELLGRFLDSIVYYEKYLKIYDAKETNNIGNNIVSITYDKKKEVISNLFISYYEIKNYDKIINEYNLLEKEIKIKLKSTYVKACFIKQEYPNIRNLYKKEPIEDNDIELLHKYASILSEEKKILLYEKLIGLTEELDNYLNTALIDKGDFLINKINYKNFYLWKGEILKKVVLKNIKNIETLKTLDNDDIKKYINYITSDYRVLESLMGYSKENRFKTDLETINFISIIENVMILNDSINEKDLKELFLRLCYNKNLYFSYIYINIFDLNENFINDLNDKFWIKIIKTIRNDNVLEKIKSLKDILKEYPRYKKVIEIITNELIIKNININIDIENEKENIIISAENYINEGKIDEGLYVLQELLKIFKTDKIILNDIVVANFMLNNIEEACNYLNLILILDDNYIDALYNLAIILEKENKINDSIFYYTKLFELIENEDLRLDIEGIIKSLKKIKL